MIYAPRCVRSVRTPVKTYSNFSNLQIEKTGLLIIQCPVPFEKPTPESAKLNSIQRPATKTTACLKL